MKLTSNPNRCHYTENNLHLPHHQIRDLAIWRSIELGATETTFLRFLLISEVYLAAFL